MQKITNKSHKKQINQWVIVSVYVYLLIQIVGILECEL